MNDKVYYEVKLVGKKIVIKRSVIGASRTGFVFENVKLEFLILILYDILCEGMKY